VLRLIHARAGDVRLRGGSLAGQNANMRRIAIFSDIHGNLTALDEVLADIAGAGISESYCLGDLIGYGPDPSGVIERLRGAGIPTIPGNYDDGVASRRGSCGCYYATDAARENGERSYDFTDGVITETDARWLLSLPREIRFEVDGARILLVHGSPRKINEYLLLDRTSRQLARLALAAEADIVCHGHIHIPYHRSFESEGRTLHYVSSGSVGKPKDGDPRACWVELVAGSEADVRAAAPGDAAVARVGEGELWLGMVVHRVTYDIDAVATAMRAAGLPNALAEALYNA